MHVGASVTIVGDHHGLMTQQFREDLKDHRGTVVKKGDGELWWVQVDGEPGPLIFNESEIK